MFKIAETEVKGGIFENENVNIDLNKENFKKKVEPKKAATVKKSQQATETLDVIAARAPVVIPKKPRDLI